MPDGAAPALVVVLRIGAPADQVGFGEDRAVANLDLRRNLLSLSETDRLALFLYYYLDLPIDQVARVTGLSVNGSKSRIHRALRRLRPGVELEEPAR